MTTITTTGAEFKRYYNDEAAWPEDAFHEDVLIHIDKVATGDNGIYIDEIADTAEVVIECGIVMGLENDADMDMLDHFEKWRRAQVFTSVIVDIDPEKRAQLEAAVLALGGVVRGVQADKPAGPKP